MPNVPTDVSSQQLNESEWVQQNRVSLDFLPVFDPTTLPVLSPQEAQNEYGFLFEPYYRNIFYILQGTIDELVAENERFAWFEYRILNYDIFYDLNEMFLVSFIKYFEIPRYQLEEEVESIRRFWIELGLYRTSEDYELPNLDIIFTFDNEIIANYYRRVQ